MIRTADQQLDDKVVMKRRWQHRNPPVGASLLAIAVCQTPKMSTDTPSSRASSLPQGGSSNPRIHGLSLFAGPCSSNTSMGKRHL
ncbi:hypothetical protein C1X65_20235 [Pseudomonas sp. FW305-70]|nr:hypothetical protein C1X65_20235 [Pseudomonas sp. FW305-70]